MQEKPLDVVLYWHMHQPEYRDLRNGIFHQPWTYLHIIKDYVDMAAHLEQNPNARAVVNFVPVLLDQINDYRIQLDDYLNQGGAIRDHLLASLAEPIIARERGHRLKLIRDCLRANEQRLIKRFAPYQKLVTMANHILKDESTLFYYDDQFIFDLLVWYHLAWMGETVRRDDKKIQALMEKERRYSFHDRRLLIEVIYELVSGVIDRYRKLAEQGRVEISMTPYAHPISPLLLDFNSAAEAMPDVSLPEAKYYPGGIERNNWHVQKGLQTFQHYFGFKPAGCWPAEGSVSEDTLMLLSEYGIQWIASGETVLRNSLAASDPDTAPEKCIHSAYNLRENAISCFFRDDGISDMIGFKFQDWHADDAVANIVETLKHVRKACRDHPAPIVSIILDGENAWEHYPENGYYFLSALYKKLGAHKSLNLTTYSEHLKNNQKPQALQKLVAGSWVYGSFSTWIGSTDKNRAWDMLVEAKHVYDKVVQQATLSAQQLERAQLQLATCESSDWFWWFGDYNPSDSVKAFDEQYRLHLCNLYHYLQQEPPEYLSHAFSSGNQASVSTGVMLPGKQH
jgi:alpha-amylase/alpha-mannosidase (GH57 family)